jgi:Uncharacterised nucleotidyltransferase
MNSINEQEIALRAALLDPKEAAFVWNEFMKVKKFHEIDSGTIRVLPAIYDNVKTLQNVAEIDRMRGAYRVAWIKNTEFISTLIPILRSFEQKGIDYRVLKGTALNFLFGSLGIRTMGDMDLIFRHSEVNKVAELLRMHGFTQTFSSACHHHGSSPLVIDSGWVNQGGIEIDLHILEKSSSHGASSFFQKIMREPPQLVSISGTVARLPPPELMLIHAVIHGDQRVALSDQIQSLLDCSRLIRVIDTRILEKFCVEENCSEKVQTYLDRLYEIAGTNNPIKLAQKDLIARSSQKIINRQKNILDQIRKLPEVIKSRRLSKAEIARIWKPSSLRDFLYSIWLTFFQLRVLEAICCKYLGGYVSEPECFSNANLILGDFAYLPKGKFLRQANFPDTSQEFRFKILPKEGHYRIKILLNSEVLKTKVFLVFYNGELAGVTSRNRDGRYEFEISGTGSAEISLRSPVRSCSICKVSFEDFKVSVMSI